MEVAKLQATPEDYIAEIDRLLMFVGRYGRQDAVSMQERIPMKTVIAWAMATNELLERENKKE